eukprot:CAMPEP_0117440778 /NCGR_PEP_ID=MMETSP0759-20121206/3272_1 /TAXON_ID=63605 /ORGANISM="Percolomonas cosmopolitus, Strain WS" /LENGTH=473 /DNA_ID=CAMNT_0005232567 /DNA_START=269 /DNA_END=1690 /DNA_ORIENTATION=-
MREAYDLFETKKEKVHSSHQHVAALRKTVLNETGLLSNNAEASFNAQSRKTTTSPSKRKQKASEWWNLQEQRLTQDKERKKIDQHTTTMNGTRYYPMMPHLPTIAPRRMEHTIDATPYKDDFLRPDHPRLLKVAIMGNPNAGKSTFLNQLIGKRVSAVSSKICTTRENTQSIFTEDNVQIVFYDTPGILEEGDTQAFSMNNELIADARLTLDKADLVLLMIDSTRDLSLINHIVRDIRNYMIEHQENDQILSQGIIAVLNKKDLVYPKTVLQEKYVEMEKSGIFTNIFFICADNGHGISNVKDFLKKISVPTDWMFPKDQVSALNRDEIIKETVREKLFTSLNEDIPYALQVQFSPIEMRRLQQIIPDRAQRQAVFDQKRYLVFFDKPETGKKYVEIHMDIFCPSGYSVMIVRKRLKRIHPKIIQSLQRSFPKREIIMRLIVKLKDKEKKQTVLSSRRLKRMRMKRVQRNESV